MGQGPLDFCRVKANFSAREKFRPTWKEVGVPKLEEFIVHRVFALMTDQEGEDSGVENKLLGRQNLVLFAGKKAWRREIVAKFASGATMVIDLCRRKLFSSR